jgi:hypothetical protein
MANIDNTTLWSDNKEKFEEIIKDTGFDYTPCQHQEPGKFQFSTRNGVPYSGIKKLSAQHPDITLWATFSFEHSWHDTLFTFEFKNGEGKSIKAEPNYMLSEDEYHTKAEVHCYDELEKKFLSIFKRLDIEIQDADGDKVIEWIDAEVTVKVEHEGFKMQGTKLRSQIDDIKIFKARKVETVEWDEISNVPF